MEAYIKSQKRTDPTPPFLWGGSGRYLYVLNCADQDVSVIDCDSDTEITQIALTAGKDFASCHYRAIDQTVIVCGLNWIAKIDANPASGTFNTVILDQAHSYNSASYIVGTYLPYPFDFFSSGGTQCEVPGGNKPYAFMSPNSRFSNANFFRVGGHSNTFNMVYYHHSGVLMSNKIQFKLKDRMLNKNKALFSAQRWFLEAEPDFGWYQDLQSINFPAIKFGNFYIVVTDANVYLMWDSAYSIILNTLSTIGVGANRSHSEWCPNAQKLFIAPKITSNVMSVVTIDYANRALVDAGDITRTAYKATNEAGCDLMFNPYNGKLYVRAHNNSLTTGVNLVHVYDPMESVLADMYQGSITVGEMQSATRASTNAQNTWCFNRTRCYEYPNVRI